jgi:hypothetical protein
MWGHFDAIDRLDSHGRLDSRKLKQRELESSDREDASQIPSSVTVPSPLTPTPSKEKVRRVDLRGGERVRRDLA